MGRVQLGGGGGELTYFPVLSESARQPWKSCSAGRGGGDHYITIILPARPKLYSGQKYFDKQKNRRKNNNNNNNPSLKKRKKKDKDKDKKDVARFICPNYHNGAQILP